MNLQPETPYRLPAGVRAHMHQRGRKLFARSWPRPASTRAFPAAALLQPQVVSTDTSSTVPAEPAFVPPASPVVSPAISPATLSSDAPRRPSSSPVVPSSNVKAASLSRASASTGPGALPPTAPSSSPPASSSPSLPAASSSPAVPPPADAHPTRPPPPAPKRDKTGSDVAYLDELVAGLLKPPASVKPTPKARPAPEREAAAKRARTTGGEGANAAPPATKSAPSSSTNTTPSKTKTKTKPKGESPPQPEASTLSTRASAAWKSKKDEEESDEEKESESEEARPPKTWCQFTVDNPTQLLKGTHRVDLPVEIGDDDPHTLADLPEDEQRALIKAVLQHNEGPGERFHYPLPKSMSKHGIKLLLKLAPSISLYSVERWRTFRATGVLPPLAPPAGTWLNRQAALGKLDFVEWYTYHIGVWASKEEAKLIVSEIKKAARGQAVKYDVNCLQWANSIEAKLAEHTGPKTDVVCVGSYLGYSGGRGVPAPAPADKNTSAQQGVAHGTAGLTRKDPSSASKSSHRTQDAVEPPPAVKAVRPQIPGEFRAFAHFPGPAEKLSSFPKLFLRRLQKLEADGRVPSMRRTVSILGSAIGISPEIFASLKQPDVVLVEAFQAAALQTSIAEGGSNSAACGYVNPVLDICRALSVYPDEVPLKKVLEDGSMPLSLENHLRRICSVDLDVRAVVSTVKCNMSDLYVDDEVDGAGVDDEQDPTAGSPAPKDKKKRARPTHSRPAPAFATGSFGFSSHAPKPVDANTAAKRKLKEFLKPSAVVLTVKLQKKLAKQPSEAREEIAPFAHASLYPALVQLVCGGIPSGRSAPEFGFPISRSSFRSGFQLNAHPTASSGAPRAPSDQYAARFVLCHKQDVLLCYLYVSLAVRFRDSAGKCQPFVATGYYNDITGRVRIFDENGHLLGVSHHTGAGLDAEENDYVRPGGEFFDLLHVPSPTAVKRALKGRLARKLLARNATV